jgi:hypothetical protein
MKGDQADMVGRLRLTLPAGWFSDSAGVLHGVLSGLAAAWVALYDLLAMVRLQSRLATATLGFLDLACIDYFGGRLSRRTAETDAVLRARLQRALGRTRGTRASLLDAAVETGHTAVVFEPARPADTGAYSTPGGLAWGVTGGWGSLAMPLECLVTVTPVAATDDVRPALAEAMPAGGAAWVRVIG